MQRAERRRQVKVTAPEAGIETLATRFDQSRFLFVEGNDAVMIVTRAEPGFRRQKRKDRVLARLAQPFHGTARHFHVGPPTREVPPQLLRADQVFGRSRVVCRPGVQMSQQQFKPARI